MTSVGRGELQTWTDHRHSFFRLLGAAIRYALLGFVVLWLTLAPVVLNTPASGSRYGSWGRLRRETRYGQSQQKWRALSLTGQPPLPCASEPSPRDPGGAERKRQAGERRRKRVRKSEGCNRHWLCRNGDLPLLLLLALMLLLLLLLLVGTTSQRPKRGDRCRLFYRSMLVQSLGRGEQSEVYGAKANEQSRIRNTQLRLCMLREVRLWLLLGSGDSLCWMNIPTTRLRRRINRRTGPGTDLWAPLPEAPSPIVCLYEDMNYDKSVGDMRDTGEAGRGGEDNEESSGSWREKEVLEVRDLWGFCTL